jgi:hypothetical protein
MANFFRISRLSNSNMNTNAVTKLNSALLPLRYPLPHKELIFSKLANANVFNKFDLKSGFWQLGISPER